MMAGMRDGHRNECKECSLRDKHERYMANPGPDRRRVQQWRLENPERYADTQRRWKESGGKAKSNRKSHLKRKFGLTPEEYAARLAAQGGVCAICERQPATGRQLDIDHDHRTGEVRGLVCNSCNQALGLLGEDTFRLMSAAAYLSGWGTPGRRLRVRLLIGG